MIVGSKPPRAIWFIAEVRSHPDLRQQEDTVKAKGNKKIILKCDPCQKTKKDAEIPPRSKKEDQSVSVDRVLRWWECGND